MCFISERPTLASGLADFTRENPKKIEFYNSRTT
jgi:hypothetical protein